MRRKRCNRLPAVNWHGSDSWGGNVWRSPIRAECQLSKSQDKCECALCFLVFVADVESISDTHFHLHLPRALPPPKKKKKSCSVISRPAASRRPGLLYNGSAARGSVAGEEIAWPELRLRLHCSRALPPQVDSLLPTMQMKQRQTAQQQGSGLDSDAISGKVWRGTDGHERRFK